MCFGSVASILKQVYYACIDQNMEETNKRNYLYYLAVGNTKLKEYATALKYIRALLQVEPCNWGRRN